MRDLDVTVERSESPQVDLAHADLPLGPDRPAEPQAEFRRAAGPTRNEAHRAFPLRRADASDPTASGPELGAAAEAFLARDALDPSSRRSYGQTLRRLRAGLGDAAPLVDMTPDQVARVFRTAWGEAAPATWNRHRAALRSFAAWTGCEGLADAVPRRAASAAALPNPLPRSGLRSLLRDQAVPARDRALWRVLHESGATVASVLALNVEDLDLPHHRARTRPGRGFICWRPATTLLLGEVAAGRGHGPLFLSARRPAPTRGPSEAADLCPQTGRRRLSYERAEYLFKRATRRIDPEGQGFTLRTLRAPV